MRGSPDGITAEDLIRIPDDGFRYELVRGRLKRMTPAGGRHGAVGVRLVRALVQHVEEHELGEVFGPDTGFTLTRDPDTVRAPDVAFVAAERVRALGGIPKGYWPGAPDLAVEILSPNDAVKEIRAKVREYLRHGTRAVWVVDPRDHTITIHLPSGASSVLRGAGTLDGNDVVPGFRLDIARLFRGLIP